MAPTLANLGDSQDVWGKHRVTTYDFTPDTAYPAGGYVVTAAQFGLRQVYGMMFAGGNSASFGYAWGYNNATGKLQIYVTSTGAEAAGDLSALKARLLVYGE